MPTSKSESTGLDEFLDLVEAEAGCRVHAGAEGHAWIEDQDDVIRLGFVLEPGRPDDNPIAGAERSVVLFPGVGPVLLGPLGDDQFADAAHPAEVPESLADLLDYRWIEGFGGDVGADGGRAGCVDPEVVAILFLQERFLDGYALVVAESGEEFGDRFDGFAIGGGGQLVPDSGSLDRSQGHHAGIADVQGTRCSGHFRTDADDRVGERRAGDDRVALDD